MTTFKVVNKWTTTEKENEGFLIEGDRITICVKRVLSDSYDTVTISKELFNEMKRVFE